MDIMTAQRLWCDKRLKLLDFYDTNQSLGCTPSNYSPDDEIDLLHEQKLLELELDSLGIMLYSIPTIGPFMEAWMVDVRFGNEIPSYFRKIHESNDQLTLEQISENIELLLNDPEKLTTKSGGNIVYKIETELRDLGFIITDRGVGNGGHIGCPCTDSQKDKLISFMWGRYKKAINNGLIFPMVAWFKPAFMNLWHRDQIEDWINNV